MKTHLLAVGLAWIMAQNAGGAEYIIQRLSETECRVTRVTSEDETRDPKQIRIEVVPEKDLPTPKKMNQDPKEPLTQTERQELEAWRRKGSRPVLFKVAGDKMEVSWGAARQEIPMSTNLTVKVVLQ